MPKFRAETSRMKVFAELNRLRIEADERFGQHPKTLQSHIEFFMRRVKASEEQNAKGKKQEALHELARAISIGVAALEEHGVGKPYN